MSDQDIPTPDPDEKKASEPLADPVESEISTLGIHHSVMREASDPNEAFDPGPRWFYILALITIVVAAFYLGKYMGAFGTAVHIGYLPPGVPAGTQAAATPAGENPQAQMSGAAVYTSKCAVCHQANGEGLPGAFPPLVNSEYVTGDPAIPVRIVLRGMQGHIEVQGVSYNGAMPAWATQLSDDEIAGVVSHIRSELEGNSAEPVDAEFVAKIRQETADRVNPWTAEELMGGQ